MLRTYNLHDDDNVNYEVIVRCLLGKFAQFSPTTRTFLFFSTSNKQIESKSGKNNYLYRIYIVVRR